MKTYLHGTSYENACNILSNGLSDEKDTIWKCSDCEKMYVRDADEDDAEYLCVESGQIAAAYTNSTSTNICIVRIIMPDEIAEDYVEDDDSCQNMYGCYQIEIKDLIKLHAENKIQIYIDTYEDGYVPYLRPFYLANVDSSYMTIQDRLLNQALNVIRNSHACYLDDIFSYGDKIYTQAYGKFDDYKMIA